MCVCVCVIQTCVCRQSTQILPVLMTCLTESVLVPYRFFSNSPDSISFPEENRRKMSFVMSGCWYGIISTHWDRAGSKMSRHYLCITQITELDVQIMTCVFTLLLIPVWTLYLILHNLIDVHHPLRLNCNSAHCLCSSAIIINNNNNRPPLLSKNY